MSTQPQSLPAKDGEQKQKSPGVGMAGAGAAAGIGAGALLMAVLQNYPGVIPQMLNWGPALFVIAGIGWFVNKNAGPFIASNQLIGSSLGRLASTVERSSGQQEHLVLRMQVNTDKLEEVIGILSDMKQAMVRRRASDVQ